MAVDTDRLDAFLGRFVSDLDATVAAGGVVVGHRPGLYRALADGPATPTSWRAAPAPTPATSRSGCGAQAAGGYVEYDAATGAFSLTEEQAFALTDPECPLYVPGAFVLALGTLRAESQITDAFRTGAGMGWRRHSRGGCGGRVHPVPPGSGDPVQPRLRGPTLKPLWTCVTQQPACRAWRCRARLPAPPSTRSRCSRSTRCW